ncbi:MAG: 3-dehydroquinate synthase [Gammaproteobacteria bacterium]|nr:3-dehydroquinate synthase [Gammaproteobacteria bacterium]
MIKTMHTQQYPIYLGTALLDTQEWKNHWKNCQRKIVIIMDSEVSALYQEKIRLSFESSPLILTFPAGERHKTRETKQMLEDAMLAAGYRRDTQLIAVGGGVACDLVGFLASTFCRGISVVYVPTTLMAMVDASIGGKTGVNTPSGKNLIGSFSFPQSVWISADFLQTLSQEEFLSGMAEVIKHAILTNTSSCAWLLQNQALIIKQDLPTLICMIEKSIHFKNQIVQQDPLESGIRQILNFGHTLGHAIEVYEHYHWLHGYAVALGMVIEANISMLLGHLAQHEVDMIIVLLKSFGLFPWSSVLDDVVALEPLLKMDKKNKNHNIHVVLLDAIGKIHHERGNYSFSVDFDTILKAIQLTKGQRC